MKKLLALAILMIVSIQPMADEFGLLDTSIVNAKLEQKMREQLEAELTEENLEEIESKSFNSSNREQLLELLELKSN